MTDREKLTNIVCCAIQNECVGHCNHKPCTTVEIVVDDLIANGVTVQNWRDAKTDPPEKYRDEYMELIPFLVCESGTECPFRACYDGKTWGDGWSAIPVTHWMPLPEPPKEE